MAHLGESHGLRRVQAKEHGTIVMPLTDPSPTTTPRKRSALLSIGSAIAH